MKLEINIILPFCEQNNNLIIVLLSNPEAFIFLTRILYKTTLHSHFIHSRIVMKLKPHKLIFRKYLISDDFTKISQLFFFHIFQVN